MTARPPPTYLLDAFVAAVRHGTFTAAAEVLGVTQGAVSRRVAELEAMLGAPLFRRVGRAAVPTPAARRLADDLEASLRRLSADLDRAAASGGGRGVLRVASLPTFAERWLLPRLAGFERAHPELRVDVTTRLAPFAFAAEPVDVAIHYGAPHWPDGTVLPLCAERMAPVAAPGLSDRLTPGRPVAAPLLHLESRPTAWADWARQAGVPTEGLSAGRRLDQFSLVVAAAVQGMGAALLPLYLIERELALGRLVALSDAVLQTEAAYHVVLPAGQPSPAARAFADWIRSRVGRGIHERDASVDAQEPVHPLPGNP